MMKHLTTLLIMIGVVVVFANHKPHFNLSPDDSNGLYDADMSGMITFEPPFFSDADFSEVDDESIIGKAMHLNDKVEEKGGVANYMAQSATDTMQESLDAAMDNYMTVVDDAINEAYEED